MNNELLFPLWYVLKEIRCTQRLIFHFLLSFWTAASNQFYCNSKTLKIRVVCIGLFISLCVAYQALVCLVIACSWSRVRQRWYLIHSRFYGGTGKILWKNMSPIEIATAWNRKIPCKILKITHNYLVYLQYFHYFINFIIISRST